MTTIAQVNTPWTVLSLLEWGSQYLSERSFDDSRLTVELLLCSILHLERIELYTNFDRPLDSNELAAFKKLFQRRLQHEPIQYILGEAVFYGIPLKVDRSVLIPRPETEELVERAIAVVRNSNRATTEILDIGTGSGNISIALAYNLPGAVITSIDVSPEALAIARVNIERHALEQIRLLEIDVFKEFLPGTSFDLIISNPPYIALHEVAHLAPEIRDYEPRVATTDEGSGLLFIERIAGLAPKRLNPGGTLLLEIGYNQQEEAVAIANRSGLTDVSVYKDYSGNPRMLQARVAA